MHKTETTMCRYMIYKEVMNTYIILKPHRAHCVPRCNTVARVGTYLYAAYLRNYYCRCNHIEAKSHKSKLFRSGKTFLLYFFTFEIRMGIWARFQESIKNNARHNYVHAHVISIIIAHVYMEFFCLPLRLIVEQFMLWF